MLHPVLDMGRYMPVYHTGTSFFPEFHICTYQYILYPFIFFHFFLTVYPCFAFKKYTGTSKLPFRVLAISTKRVKITRNKAQSRPWIVSETGCLNSEFLCKSLSRNVQRDSLNPPTFQSINLGKNIKVIGMKSVKHERGTQRILFRIHIRMYVYRYFDIGVQPI
jgi:hypothetical protein